jgi:hypothetical protein
MATRASYPRFNRPDSEARVQLTKDDAEILRRVFRYRFIRASDLYRLLAHRSSDRISRRLVRMYRAGFLDRPPAQIDRFRAGGSQSLVYGLARKGAAYLAETNDLAVSLRDWKSRNETYTRENLDHTLAVTRFLVDLELACSKREGLELIPSDEIAAAAQSSGLQLSPVVRWSVPVSWHGRSGKVQIAPDAVFGLRFRNPSGAPRRTFIFLEVDRGTMTIVPARQVRESDVFLFRATILRKLLTYAESYRQGLHRDQLGLPTARVLLLTSSPARAEAMRAAAHRFVVSGGRVPAGLFLFGETESSTDVFHRSFIDANGTPTALVPSE